MNYHHDHDHDCGCKMEKPKNRHRDWDKHNDCDKHRDWHKHDDCDKHRDWHKHDDCDKHDDRDKHRDWDKHNDCDKHDDHDKHDNRDKHRDWDKHNDCDKHDDHDKHDNRDKRRDWHNHNDCDKHDDHDKHDNRDKHRDWHKHNDCDKHNDRDKHRGRDKDFHDCGCKKDRDNGDNEKHSSSCVCKKVRDINEAQHEVERKKHGCDVSCDRSIKELLNQNKHSDFDTIPFKLLCGCKGDCETFVGTGVIKMDGCFFDIRSSFFRVSDFVKGSDCCAILELLCPERCEGKHNGIEGFIRTGACLEVDLKDFTGITCFPPVKAKKMDHKKILCSDSKKKSR